MSNNCNKLFLNSDFIEAALYNRATRTFIAKILGKNKSTVCRKVKFRRYDKGVIRCSYRDRNVGL